jgi:hypothetical protein
VKFLIVALAACTSWRPQHVALESAFVVATAIDWHQTETYTAHCTESNPVLGSCGQHIPVDLYFPLVIAAHLTFAALIDGDYRTAWAAFGAGVESQQVWSNYVE